VIATRLDLEASIPLVYLERVRFAGDEPLALDRVWLPASLAEGLLDADFSHTSLYNELAERTGLRLDHGREDIRAVNPTPAERALLHCPADAAAFSINRLGHAQGRKIEWRHTVVRGDRFALAAEFSAHDGYRLTPATASGAFTA
jgi:GntR family transcriptional regulator